MLRARIWAHFKNNNRTHMSEWLWLRDFVKRTKVWKLVTPVWIWCIGRLKHFIVEWIPTWSILTFSFVLFPNGDYRGLCRPSTYTMTTKTAFQGHIFMLLANEENQIHKVVPGPQVILIVHKAASWAALTSVDNLNNSQGVNKMKRFWSSLRKTNS